MIVIMILMLEELAAEYMLEDAENDERIINEETLKMKQMLIIYLNRPAGTIQERGPLYNLKEIRSHR